VDGGDRLVWYVSYGSNMHLARFTCYLSGGRPHGGARMYPDSRDPRPPARSVALELPGTVYFAHESAVWTGGMAFYDPDAPGRAHGRAHLVTAAQFSDIAGQETHRPPGHDLDLDAVLAAGGRAELGPGRYETLVCPGMLEGLPVFTFTAPWGVDGTAWTKPTGHYLRHVAAGLAEAGAWDRTAISAYLAERPGAAGAWTVEEIDELVKEPCVRAGTGVGAAAARVRARAR
jgi:hypothetical protein